MVKKSNGPPGKKKTKTAAVRVPLPKPALETPTLLHPEQRLQLEAALRARVVAAIDDVDDIGGVAFGASIGRGAALAVAVCGDDDRAFEVFVFVRGALDGADGSIDGSVDSGDDDAPRPPWSLDGALGVAVDILDAVVGDVVKALVAGDTSGPPLDWHYREVDGHDTFVRGELRKYALEEQAAALLGDPVPPRALPLTSPPSTH
jgi:hypothetical protein